jgi:hypothetical protein
MSETCIKRHRITLNVIHLKSNIICDFAMFFYLLLIRNQKTLYIHAFYGLMCGLDCQWARRGSIDTSLVYSVEGLTAL